jgi:hypothetical protein
MQVSLVGQILTLPAHSIPPSRLRGLISRFKILG